jgi:3-methyl-2-oxobutanoate hydroxymethyltransferase
MQKRLSTADIKARKNKEPLVALTCYTAPMARILDPHVDILLVGDSLGMVLYGMDSTLSVTLDMMIAHGRAVVKTSSLALVVVDMPFGSYQQSKEQAFASCARVMAETGAQGVKLEGGAEMAETIQYLVERGIPVMGHVGLMPQHVNVLGGYRYRGKNDEEAKLIQRNALAVEKAGVFSMVFEGIRENVARDITKKIKVPTIGIGASPACDGQVLVTEDMLGMSGDYVPSFVKQFGNVVPVIEKAVKAYHTDVRARKFPGPDHYFNGKKS